MSKTRYWSEMSIDELTDNVAQHLHSELLVSGGKGMKLALRSLLVDIANNSKDYTDSWRNGGTSKKEKK